MLLDSVLDDFGAVPNVAQVGVDPLDHLVGPMPQLARDRVDRDRRAAIERLQPGRAVGVTEGLRPELTGVQPGPLVTRSSSR
jgi:hypothetical protein